MKATKLFRIALVAIVLSLPILIVAAFTRPELFHARLMARRTDAKQKSKHTHRLEMADGFLSHNSLLDPFSQPSDPWGRGSLDEWSEAKSNETTNLILSPYDAADTETDLPDMPARHSLRETDSESMFEVSSKPSMPSHFRFNESSDFSTANRVLKQAFARLNELQRKVERLERAEADLRTDVDQRIANVFQQIERMNSPSRVEVADNVTSTADGKSVESVDGPRISIEPFGGEENRFTVVVRDEEISLVLEMLARKAESNILIGRGVKGRVSAHLDDVSLGQALRTILRSQDCVLRREGRFLFAVSRADARKGFRTDALILRQRKARIRAALKDD